MAVHTYECLFLLEPNKASTDWDGVSGAANGILARHGAEIVATRAWRDMKLAYPIAKFKRGIYLLTYFRAEPTALREIEADIRLSEVILRKMIIKLHPRVAEHLIELYTAVQEEPATA